MNTTAGLEAEDFDTLDNILDDLRERFEETPQWEFCEGFIINSLHTLKAN